MERKTYADINDVCILDRILIEKDLAESDADVQFDSPRKVLHVVAIRLNLTSSRAAVVCASANRVQTFRIVVCYEKRPRKCTQMVRWCMQTV